MEHRFIDKTIKYDGTQLKSHWIFRETGTMGDCVASFVGPADVPLQNMVDLADVAAKENIYSTSMLHFIAEHFESDLASAILRQRIFAAIALEELKKFGRCDNVERRGDDLYDGDKKLSVSIATASPVSCLMHFAINIRSDKTPVPTKGLVDYDIDPVRLANSVMRRYKDELETAQTARCKVRAVT